MSFSFNSQMSGKHSNNPEFSIQIVTDNYEQFLFMQDMAHECIDGKHKEKKGDTETFAEHYNTIVASVEHIEYNPFLTDEWSQPLYQCTKCGNGYMHRNNMIELCSLPPQYLYKCDECGYEEYKDR